MMNRKLAIMLLALPLGTLTLGASLSQAATAAEITPPVAVRQAPVMVAQRFDNDRDNDRREAIRREEARREALRREEARRDHRVWIAGHWQSGFLGIGRKWVAGHWENR